MNPYNLHYQSPLYPQNFDENGLRYRICCCHVRTCAIIIATLEILGLVTTLCGGIGTYANSEALASDDGVSVSLSGLIGGIVGFVIGIGVIILLLFGVLKEHHLLLIPHLIMQVIAIVLLVLAAFGYFFLAAAIGSRSERYGVQVQDTSRATAILAVSGVIILIIATVEGFFFYAIFRAYRFLKDKQISREAASQTQTYVSYAAIGDIGKRYNEHGDYGSKERKLF